MRLALMIEGQEGLTWEHWRRLARTAEDGGFDSLFRSDHLTGLFGDSRRPSLDTWASLTWLATATTRMPASVAVAGFVPCALVGMRHTSRRTSPRLR